MTTETPVRGGQYFVSLLKWIRERDRLALIKLVAETRRIERNLHENIFKNADMVVNGKSKQKKEAGHL